MRELIIASKNEGKIREIVDILDLHDVNIHAYKDFEDWPDVEETGDTFYENALIKARALVEKYNKPAVADDSGLEVDALGGAPGVYSSRYGGEEGNDVKNITKLLRELKGTCDVRRMARFRCVAVLMTPDGWVASAEGMLEGRIGSATRGDQGFGYDPVFIPTGQVRTLAEMGLNEKNKISHRAQAFTKLKEKMGEFRQHAGDC
ncbi:MAG TPA: XTP/dITP diphosphatase [Candidatus Aquicultor sp.]|jgi:XTP/dITP diphosphohydrolase